MQKRCGLRNSSQAHAELLDPIEPIALPQECKELGIAGRNVDAELRGLDRLLGRQLADAAAACKSGAAAEAVAYYGAFSAYAHNGEGPGEGDADEGAPVPSLRALQSGGALPGAGE